MTKEEKKTRIQEPVESGLSQKDAPIAYSTYSAHQRTS